jgi:hypothetical protein
LAGKGQGQRAGFKGDNRASQKGRFAVVAQGQVVAKVQPTVIEQALSDLPMPITFLRPAWFMENCRWDVVPACEQGVIPSFLQPLDKPVPMVATADIGKLALPCCKNPGAATAW